MFAGYQPAKIELPVDEAGLEGYLEKMTELLPNNDAVRKKLDTLRALEASRKASPALAKTKSDAAGQHRAGTKQAASASAVPICGTRL